MLYLERKLISNGKTIALTIVVNSHYCKLNDFPLY